ncbi:glycerol-3-phosphate acyltransferase 1, mitochondrial isoform X3 [Chrysoperla carnea]|uniref:glycerol-3-phosphate acyltransferase 1, mitochondrial isoform X3 n=1 Tax=Chrysoperla carnea TaxID=189513 RepID=UPI001D0661A6|nr:glycerol-3-phosphate acyltransferase 1, mitochondrial isoform X3 [Chrysoperla carnea]
MDGLIAEYIILLGLFYWLFSAKAYAMVDVLTTRLHDAYTNWTFRPADNDNESRLTLSGLRRIGGLQKRNKIAEKELNKQVKEKYLYQVKENPPPPAAPLKPRPFMGLSCKNCTPSSRNLLVNRARENSNIKNILRVDALKANNFLTRKFCHIVQAYRLKKYDFPQVSDTVLHDERLREALQMATTKDLQDMDKADDETYQKQLKKNENRAKTILYDMRSTLSDFLLRLTSWVMYKVLPCFLSSVVAHPGQVEMLKKAAESGVPLIFLPLHRSHLDYILISFILLNNDIRSPLVAAGDNLRIPLFGFLLRGLGAFYIKRRIDPVLGRKDIVYRAVLHTYMMEALRAGHNIEFFIEGGRTRTGKPCMPKGGILSVIVDAYMDGTIEDALLVPVSINYERLVDGNFVREQLGQPKQMESLGSALKAIWSVLNSNYGMMRIDFNQPFSIKELIKTFHIPSRSPTPEEKEIVSNGTVPPLFKKPKLVSQPSTASLYGTDVVEEKHRKLVDSIARHVIYDCTQATAIMSTNAVAFLLLNRFRDGCTMDQLVVALDKLRAEVDWAGRDLGFSGDSLDVVNHALDVLGPALVRRDKTQNTILPVCMLPNVIELAYYSNGMMSFYVVDAIIATALFTLLPDVTCSSQLSEDDIIERSKELCDLLKYEFIINKPCQTIESVIADGIDNLKNKEILTQKEILYTEDEKWSQRVAKTFDDDDSSSGDDAAPPKINEPNLQFNSNTTTLQHLCFLRGLIRPLIEAYYITGTVLHKLVDRNVTEKELVLDIMEEIKKELHLGSLSYSESLSVDPVRNCLKLLQHWQVLESHTQDKIRMYYLSEHYDDNESLKPILIKLCRFKTPLNNNK